MQAYDDRGSGGVPVVLLHGLSSARSTWNRLVPVLEARGRVVAVDHRGHGESPHAPGTYDLDHYAEDTVGFLGEVVGEPAVLVGHSLGGVIAFHVAQQHPELVRGIVLEDPPLFVGQRDPDVPPSGVAAFFPMLRDMLRDMRARGATVEDYEAVVRGAPAVNGSGTMAETLGEDGTRAHALAWHGLDPEVFTPAIEGGALGGVQPDSPVACPVTVVRADPALRAAFTEDDAVRFAATNPHARIVLAEGASHAVHDEQPDVVRDAVLAMLDSL